MVRYTITCPYSAFYVRNTLARFRIPGSSDWSKGLTLARWIFLDPNPLTGYRTNERLSRQPPCECKSVRKRAFNKSDSLWFASTFPYPDRKSIGCGISTPIDIRFICGLWISLATHASIYNELSLLPTALFDILRYHPPGAIVTKMPLDSVASSVFRGISYTSFNDDDAYRPVEEQARCLRPPIMFMIGLCVVGS